MAAFRKFKRTHWQLSPKVETDEEIRALFSSYDALVIGSDQIWNSACIPDMGLYYYGIHADTSHTRLVAYAPSFGHNRFEAKPEEIEKLRQHLQRFHAISCRETDGVKILHDLFGVENATVALDPTLLLTPDYYRELAHVKHTEEDDTLAYYLLDATSEKLEVIKRLAREMHLRPVNIYKRTDEERTGCRLPLVSRVTALRYPSVESWLSNLQKARFVVTDSFHGTVFSILFNQQFIAFANSKRGNSRFENLLSQFGLSDRLLTPPTEIHASEIPHISYETINERIAELRNRSLHFLEESLQ